MYLIIGGNGLIGKSFQKKFKSLNKSYAATFHKNNAFKGQNTCNILIKEDLKRVFEAVKPKVVINATNLAGGVDYCEKNPQLAEDFHLSANIEIGKLCKTYNARMILISSDYVFDGLNFPYKEDDLKNPLNKYGEFKLKAEEWIQEKLDFYNIIRTTNVFGWDPYTRTPNFLMNVYFKLFDNQKIAVPSYLWGNPTYVDNLVEAIIDLETNSINGVFHVVGKSFVNRYEWALKFCDFLGKDRSLLIEVPIQPENFIPRPLKSCLNTDKFEKVSTTRLLDVNEGLEEFIYSMNNDNII